MLSFKCARDSRGKIIAEAALPYSDAFVVKSSGCSKCVMFLGTELQNVSFVVAKGSLNILRTKTHQRLY